MATKVFPITSSASRAKQANHDPQIMGVSDALGAGYAGVFDYSFYFKALMAAADWTDVLQITSVHLHLFVPPGLTASSFPFGKPTNNSGFTLGTLAAPFPDNTKTSFFSANYGSPAYHSTPAPLTNYELDATPSVMQDFNITTAFESMAPTNIKDHNGKPCRNQTNYGWWLQRRKSSHNSSPEIVIASETYPDSDLRPVIVMTYVARPSVASVALTDPPPVITQIEGEFFEGDYLSSGPTELLTWTEIQVYAASVPIAQYDDIGSKALWTTPKTTPPTGQLASASETQAAHFMVPLPVQLKSAGSYKWRARCRNQSKSATAWTAAASLTVQTQAPVVATRGPAGAFPTLDGVSFTARFSDPDSNELLSYRIQVRGQTASSDPNWGDGPFYWDTSDRLATEAERTWLTDAAGKYSLINLLYGGAALPVGDFSWRIAATDSYGAVSAWSYGGFSTTQPDEPDPGNTDFLTGYARRQVRHRIVIRTMGTLRAPGTVAALIEDAANIGASEYYNSGGEFYFTLPATHPQVGAIEPWQVHYALEVYRGQGWVELTAGLITDFDASDDDVIFYGIDYLGILGLLVDERFNPNASDAKAVLYPAVGSGAKYTNERIDRIVTDQLQRAIHGTNSPVAFIGLVPVPVMAEALNIFTTFKTRLSFIGGLLDSHRGANLGDRTRLKVRKSQAQGYQFQVELNPGKDRDNIRLEYGGLVQGVRIIGFGTWATRVMAIGQRTVSGSPKVDYYPDATGVLSETVYGRVPKVNIWQDISDTNDLKRRANLMARQLSKVGKRVALGLRVDSLGIKDGWDICDSVPIDIDRGVINTDLYGSGYWTILGWALQVWPDGHTDLTLTLLPKLDAEGTNDTIQGPDPIHNTPEWAIASGPPDATTFELMATRTYVDSDTGEVYNYDTVEGVWVLDTEANLVGPPGPEGPPGPPGGGGSSDTIPPALPTGLDLTTGAVLQADGALRPYLQGVWDDPVDADFDHFDVQLTPATLARPGHGAGVGWSLEARAGASTLPPGGYVVGVTAYGVDGGETPGFTESGSIVAGAPATPVTYAYNAPIFTRTNIALPDFYQPASFYPEVTDVYNDSALCVTFDIDGPVDLVFRSYGGYTALLVDGVDVLVSVGGGDGGFTLRQTPYHVPAGTHHLVLTGSGNSGGHNFAFAGMTATSPAVSSQQLVVKGLLSSLGPDAGSLVPTFAIYVGPVGTVPLFLGTTTADEYVIGAVGSGLPMPDHSEAIEWASPSTIPFSPVLPSVMAEDVQAGWYYAIRVQAVDTSGNRSGWAGPDDVISANDDIAPAIPGNLSATPGYGIVGLRWDRSSATDLDRYQIRWRATDDAAWAETLNIYASFAVVDALDIWATPPAPASPGPPPVAEVVGVPAEYEFQVRAIDRSGNVQGGRASDLEAGWSASATAKMSPIPVTEIAFKKLFSEWAYLINVSATNVTAGHLNMTPGPNDPSSIIVWADANMTKMAGYWSPSGWYLIDPNQPNKAIRGKNGAISFTSHAYYPGSTDPGGGSGQVWQTPDPLWTLALSADGISAELITVGGMPGGANRLLNSGFELAPRPVPPAPFAWDTAAEWDAAISSVNKSAGTAALTQAKYRYTDV